MGVQGPEGQVFAGKYRINRLIGKGGMANVYLGTDLGSGMNVAIKIMKPEFSADEEFIRRFDTEARAVSSLNHANIVKVFGVGHEGNFRYIVQEYVEGITVKELINQNGHLDWKVAVPIVIQIGMALDYAHKNGIIHRDIKPQNILISRERIAKITDFGIARASTGNTITMSSGGAMGSVHYFSPEQARGGNVGPGSDIYSMGVMLFEMVTGRVPFDGDSNVAIAVKHLQEKPPMASSFVPDIPNGLDNSIFKCMQKSPDKRYSSMRQMVTELDALMVDPNGIYGVINDTSENERVNVSFRQDPSYEKISDLEKSAEHRRRSRLRDNIMLTLLIVMIVGVLMALGILVITSIQNATESINVAAAKDYTVKNYVGMTQEEVIAELEANNIRYTIKAEPTSDYTPGIVIRQSINEGIVLAANSSVHTIELTVSAEEDQIILADYANLDYHQAYQSLIGLGFSVSVLDELNEDIEPDHVIRTEPAAGTPVTPGTNVIIVYAKEPTTSTVPNLYAMNLTEARQAVEEAGLTIGTIEGAEEVLALPEDQQFVMLTDPVSNMSLQRRAAITLFVGSQEDLARGGTPTPTPISVPVIVNVIGSGTVEGGGEYNPNTTVVLTAHPAEGFSFDHWQDIYGNVVAFSSEYRFLTGETGAEFTAVFTALPTSTPTPTPTPEPTATPTPEPQPSDTSSEVWVDPNQYPPVPPGGNPW